MSAAPTQSPGWFDAKTGLQAAQVLLSDPLRVLELVGHQFTVLEDLERFGVHAAQNDRSALTLWTAGVGGVVVSVEYTGGSKLGGWYVVMEHDNDQLCFEERWPHLRVVEFVRRTWPSHWKAKEQAA